MILSHHPECEQFKNHTIKIGKNRFCIGCFVGYPSAIIGILALYFLNFGAILSSNDFLIFGIFLLSSFILSPLNLTKAKLVKIVQKVLIGFGSAFLFWWIWTLSNVFIQNLFFFLGVFGFLLIILNAYHMYGMHKICKKCEYKLDWDDCPGFKTLNLYLKQNNLPKVFRSSKNWMENQKSLGGDPQ